MSLIALVAGSQLKGAFSPWYLNAKADGIDPTLYLDFANDRYAAKSVRTNYVYNSTFSGVSNINLPNMMWVMSQGGITREYIGTGVENGLYYVDLRFSGTATNTNTHVLYFGSDVNYPAAIAGQIWTCSLYSKIIAGSLVNIDSLSFGVDELNSSNGYLIGSASSIMGSISSSIQRFQHARTLNNASTLKAVGKIGVRAVNGTAIDITIRLYGPQLENRSVATSYIPTSTGAVTVSSYEAKPFSDVFSFTRASTATYFDSAGIMRTAAIDTPRFDHDPATGEALGLLIEGQRTNYVLNTNPQDASWTISGATKTNEVGTMVGLLTTPVKVRSNGATWHRLQTQGISVTSGSSYSLTVFVAAGQGGQIKIQMRNDTAATESYITGNVGEALTTTLTAFGVITYLNHVVVSGGYIYYASFVPNATTTARLGVGPNSAVAGDAVILYSAQFEAGAFPSSFIPTAGSAVTRSADIITNSESNTVKFADWYNQSEGALLVKAKGIGGDSGYPRTYEISDGTSANRHCVLLSPTVRNVSMEFFSGSAFQASRGTSISGLSAFNTVAAYKLNDFAFSINGDSPTTDTSGTPPTVTKLNVGSDYSGSGSIYYGYIRELRYYNKRISNSEMQRITT